jgi:hypothetical protein
LTKIVDSATIALSTLGNDMIGFRDIQRIERVQETARQLGMQLGRPSFSYDKDVITLYPAGDESLPIYSRDTPLFTGDLDQVESFLTGLQWARNYDKMIRLSTDKRRSKKEQDYRNQQLINILSRDKVNDAAK